MGDPKTPESGARRDRERRGQKGKRRSCGRDPEVRDERARRERRKKREKKKIKKNR